MRVSANVSAEACRRCVRAKEPCVPAPVAGRQQKCNRCSRLKHACEEGVRQQLKKGTLIDDDDGDVVGVAK